MTILKIEMTWAEMCQLMGNHPAAVSRYFNNSVQKCIKHVLCSQHVPFGTVKDFLIMLNFSCVVVLICMVYCG